jgi:hypothetical protein
MAKQPENTTVPYVPIRTPMFDDPKFTENSGNLHRTWIIFFERLFTASAVGGAQGPFQRTLLLKDCTVGNDIADHVTIWIPGMGVRVIGVLRKAVTVDLSLRIKVNGTSIGIFTIPHTTAIDHPITWITSPKVTAVNFPDLAVLSWDVTGSDASQDSAGIASYTVEWQPPTV